MRMSQLYMPTLRENPAEAEISSHQLLLRGGMIRRLVSGVYSYLPLGYRVVRKIEEVVRQEMDKKGAQELLMSAIMPRELWEATGRWDNFGPEMFKLSDRHNREFCLGPTHEEYFTSVVKDEVKSYKQLPMNLYQIQTKYRDEKRPRFGVIRAREFIMKDAYTFDKDEKGMEEAYMVMWDAYEKIFDRLKLKYIVVQGDSGAMGGNNSHEFIALSDVGEGAIAYCNSCNYAATDEKAEVFYKVREDDSELDPMEKVYTPNATTINDLEDLFKIHKSNFAKALVYNASGKPVIAIVPGDRELNEVKLVNHLGIPAHELELADEDMIRDISGADKGFTGPINLAKEVLILVDGRITKMKNLVVGGNERDYHIKNVNYKRDFSGEIVKDLLMIEEGDLCPKCGERLTMERGIEVGNIFQLGTKYSSSLNAKYLDENGKEQLMYMGSYGVGVSRLVAAIVEQYHDDKGIIWPILVAPYQAIVTIVNINDEYQRKVGEKLYKELLETGVEVLLDDRKERAGVKFNDRDLIGIPLRVTVGKKAGEGLVEFSTRAEGENKDLSLEEVRDIILEEVKGIKLI